MRSKALPKSLKPSTDRVVSIATTLGSMAFTNFRSGRLQIL
jgi:hypothetical protein